MKDRTFPRHIHVWREIDYSKDRSTALVTCAKCEANRRDNGKFLFPKVAREFRRQVRHGIEPHFVRGELVGVDWAAWAANRSNA